MYKGLLSVIAVCLVMITAKLYVPQVQAEVDGMDFRDLYRDEDFSRAVAHAVERDCKVSGSRLSCDIPTLMKIQ
jgi:hypothetical protein|tara:strand:+ start:106 stop:327 length:222 start_codon:yes stop_codon:yes gene_type:complete